MKNIYRQCCLSVISLILVLAGCSLDPAENSDGDGNVTIPVNVNAVAIAAGSIQINWTGINGADRYNIYRSLTSTGDYDGLFYVTATNFVDTELQPATTYYYKVSAVKGGAESLQSSPASAKTFSAEQVPAAPLGVNAVTLSTGSIIVSWNPVQKALSYRVYRSDGDGDNYSLKSTPTNNSYTDTGLSPGTTYYYKIAAANGSGEGPQSNASYAMTSSAGGGTVPSAPSGLNKQNVTASSITLEWTAVAGVEGYIVHRSPNGSSPWEIKGTSAAATFTDVGLNASTTYWYKVSAVNESGEGEASLPLSASTADGGGNLPSPPTGVSAQALSSTIINITWTAVTGASSYIVYRSNTMSGSYNQTGFPSSNSFADSSVSPSTPYYYKVSAVNVYGEGLQSQITTATTSGGGTYPPSQPGGLKFTSASSSAISLSWIATSGATGYKVYRANAGSSTYALIDPTVITNTYYTDTTITAGNAYAYKIAAVNVNGNSPQSVSAYAFAVNYNDLRYFNAKQQINMTGNGKHYYRLSVTAGTSYTIENQDYYGHDGTTVTEPRFHTSRVTAWQNDGTQIFDVGYSNLYANPRTFTATYSGYVTVEVKSVDSQSGNYAIYYYEN